MDNDPVVEAKCGGEGAEGIWEAGRCQILRILLAKGRNFYFKYMGGHRGVINRGLTWSDLYFKKAFLFAWSLENVCLERSTF